MARAIVSFLYLLCLLPLQQLAAEGAAQPAYHELNPSLVVNLPTGAKYIRCDVQLMTMDPERLADIELHAPAIRHELLMLLSEQDGAELQTQEGKALLLEKALEVTRQLMRELTGKGIVEEVFFTAFFVQ